jgi:hypothetical protein
MAAGSATPDPIYGQGFQGLSADAGNNARPNSAAPRYLAARRAVAVPAQAGAVANIALQSFFIELLGVSRDVSRHMEGLLELREAQRKNRRFEPSWHTSGASRCSRRSRALSRTPRVIPAGLRSAVLPPPAATRGSIAIVHLKAEPLSVVDPA